MFSQSLGGKVDKERSSGVDQEHRARLSCAEAENRVLRLAVEQLLECAEADPCERREAVGRVALLLRRWPTAAATERVVS